MIEEIGDRYEVMIRDMQKDDLQAVVALERRIFPDPWPRSAFVEQSESDGWGARVAESDGRIVGYACYFIVAGESHLTNIAVDPKHRRKSVACKLLDDIITIVLRNNCEFILLEVRPSNSGAIAFYERYQFQLLYRRPDYYRSPVEDALVMVRYFDN